MSYLRDKNGIYSKNKAEKHEGFYFPGLSESYEFEADSIRELIQPGDIIFYWHAGSKKEHCIYVADELAARDMQSWPITRLLIPVGINYKQVAAGNPKLLNNEYLISAGELELI